MFDKTFFEVYNIIFGKQKNYTQMLYFILYFVKGGKNMLNDKEWAKNIENDYKKYIEMCKEYQRKPMTILQFILAITNKRTY